MRLTLQSNHLTTATFRRHDDGYVCLPQLPRYDGTNPLQLTDRRSIPYVLSNHQPEPLLTIIGTRARSPPRARLSPAPSACAHAPEDSVGPFMNRVPATRLTTPVNSAKAAKAKCNSATSEQNSSKPKQPISQRSAAFPSMNQLSRVHQNVRSEGLHQVAMIAERLEK